MSIIELLTACAIAAAPAPDSARYTFEVTQYTPGTGRETVDTAGVKIPLNMRGIDPYITAFKLIPVPAGDWYNMMQRNRDTTMRWHNPTAEKSLVENWYYTLIYEDGGRLVEYSYSGCGVCSLAPYSYAIEYGQNNKPAVIRSTVGAPSTELIVTYQGSEVSSMTLYRDGQRVTTVSRLFNR